MFSAGTHLRLLGLMAAICCSAAATAADSQNCTLRLDASVDVARTDDGQILVPVNVNDHSLQLMLNTATVAPNLLFQPVADTLGLESHNVRTRYMLGSNHETSRVFQADRLQIGSFRITGAEFIVLPATLSRQTNQFAGQIGPELLRNFDLELDPARNKLSLYSQDHCSGAVVSWTKEWTDVPMRVDKWGIPHVWVTIDGKAVDAEIGTALAKTRMTIDAARGIFGLRPESPGMVASEPPSPSVSNTPNKYRYPFGQLVFGGVAINKPDIVIVRSISGLRSAYYSAAQQPELEEDRKQYADVIIGIDILSKLHFYMAYREQHFYASAANAH